MCRRLREDPRFDSVPIVIVTGHDDSEAMRTAFEAGATDFVSKPVNWALLPRRLEYILRNADAGRALRERMSQVRTLVDALPDSLWVVSPTGEIRWSSNARIAAQRHDVAAPEESDTAIAPAAQMRRLLAAICAAPRPTARSASSNSASRTTRSIAPSRSASASARVAMWSWCAATPPSARRAAERIERLAYFDPLTGLANRHCCLDRAGDLDGAGDGTGGSPWR